jgi:hypothetical protein
MNFVEEEKIEQNEDEGASLDGANSLLNRIMRETLPKNMILE